MSGERWFEDDGKLIQQRTFDVEPAFERARFLRDRYDHAPNENWFPAGVIDSRMLSAWLKEDGVGWSDAEGVQNSIRRRLINGDFSKFRAKDNAF